MNLPNDLQDKIDILYTEFGSKLKQSRQNLTKRYKDESGQGESLIKTRDDSIIYAISRMPATFAVISSLLEELVSEGKLNGISTIFDVGSGTGAGYFAAKGVFENASIELFERDENMAEVFSKLEPNKRVVEFDLTRDDFGKKADLIMTSYVLSEMGESERISAVKKMLAGAEKYLLLIDTGTPRTYENFMTIKRLVLSEGYSILAPCESEKCGLKNDYCQFYARFNRSRLQRLSKDAELPYEDEKYFYLLIAKNASEKQEKRVIRRPQIKTNLVELKLCSAEGVKDLKITKKDKELYKRARKVKINETI